MKKSLFLSLLLLCISTLSIAQSNTTTSTWKGFRKNTFDFEGRQAWVVEPSNPKPFRPWVWRAHFPDWHTEMDSILLTKGYHIAYVNTNNMFGNAEAMQVWDRFYTYLTKEKQLSPKVTLEGVSRGGLYVYGWAKRNPAKVDCIYAEAPVCDPKSWPGGKGAGIGSEKDWNEWLKLTNSTEATASEYKDIPLNDLEGLAAYKVPIIHVIGLDDKVVPNAENTYPLVEKYIRLGGPAFVYPMTRGEQKLNGHHFPIEDPLLFANMIEQFTSNASPLSHENYVTVNNGLGNAFDRFKQSKKGTVAYLGGSITYNPGWRTKTSQFLQEQFPDTEFQFIAAGIPSLGSTPHAFRFQQDVLQKGTPDLLFIESAVNDRTNGFSKTAQVRALEGIIAQAKKANPNISIVVMAFADPDKNGDYEKNLTPVEVTIHQQVAQRSGASFINLAQEVYDRMQAKEFSWKFDFKDLHPSPFGQEVYFASIKHLLTHPQTAVNKPSSTFTVSNPYAYSSGHYYAIHHATKLKGFTINPSWEPSPKFPTRPGFVKVPMLTAEQEGDSFELTFTGKGIGIAIVSGPDAGILTYQIDGKKEQHIDLSSQWSNQLHLPWYLMLNDELKQGKHVLKAQISKNTNTAQQGSACRIVHFLVN